ncbi:MAG: hypothetical protein HQK49_03940 [Oligoflexia bacterium]|nr:hypothetical protein [Oligoflexia bacterium]
MNKTKLYTLIGIITIFLAITHMNISYANKNDVRIMKNKVGHWSIISSSKEEVLKQITALATASRKTLTSSNTPNICCKDTLKDKSCFAEISSVTSPHVLNILGKRAVIDGPNCFNAALYFNESLPFIDFLSEAGIKYALKNSGLCTKIEGSLQPGDIGYIKDLSGNGTYTHAYVHISDKLIFQKTDSSLDTTYEFRGSEWLENYKDTKNFKKTFYRCKSLKNYLLENPGMAKEIDNALGGENMSLCSQDVVKKSIPLTEFSINSLLKESSKITLTMLGHDESFIDKIQKQSVEAPFLDKQDLINEFMKKHADEIVNKKASPDIVKAVNLLELFTYINGSRENMIIQSLGIIAQKYGRTTGFENLDPTEYGEFSCSLSDLKEKLDNPEMKKALAKEMIEHYKNREANLAKDNIFGKLLPSDLEECPPETSSTTVVPLKKIITLQDLEKKLTTIGMNKATTALREKIQQSIIRYKANKQKVLQKVHTNTDVANLEKLRMEIIEQIKKLEKSFKTLRDQYGPKKGGKKNLLYNKEKEKQAKSQIKLCQELMEAFKNLP